MTATAYKAKDFLKPLCVLNQEYRAVCARLAILHASNSSGTMETRKYQLKREIESGIQSVSAILKAAQLPPLEQAIIELRYVNGYEWQEVQYKINRSRRSLMRLHTRALEKLGEVMEGANRL
jgi:DNA-directed RNA polymerase specialized sigma24 family protein